MSWAMDCAGTVATRGAWAWIAGLLVLTTHPGCARLESFTRSGGPPVIGSIPEPEPARGADARGAVGVNNRLARGRAAASNDLYAQSFCRTRPRIPPANNEDPSLTPSGTHPAGTPEPGTEMAALDSDSPTGTSGGLGVDLQPPVALRASSYSTAPPADGPADPTQPEAPPATAQNEAPEAREPPSSAHEAGPTVESLVAACQARLDQLTSYQVTINGQERIGEVLQPPEDVVLSIRRNPRAVRLEWRDGPHKGREVLYSPTETNGLMMVNMGDSAIPMPRLSLAPDSPLALRNSRQPITDAGFDAIIGGVRDSLARSQSGDASGGKITYGGLEQPEPLDHPCHVIVRVTPTAEVWKVYLDPESKLPAMVEGQTGSKELLERFVFRNVQANPSELAANDAFNPDRRWGEDRGLLNRLATAANAKEKKAPEDVKR